MQACVRERQPTGGAIRQHNHVLMTQPCLSREKQGTKQVAKEILAGTYVHTEAHAEVNKNRWHLPTRKRSSPKNKLFFGVGQMAHELASSVCGYARKMHDSK